MATTPNLKIDGLDFTSIRENLKTYLQSQNQFQDYNFDSSGLSFILDILSYNTYYNSFYVNMVSNEAFLSTAQRRNSVVNLARSLNYTPRSVSSARVHGTLTMTAVDAANTPSIAISKNSEFESYINENRYLFLTSAASTALKNANNQYIIENLTMIEGETISETYINSISDPNQRFIINNANVDISTLSVSVLNSTTDSTLRVFNRAENILYINGTSLVYFIEEVEDGKFEVFFGDDFLGKKLDDGNVITFEYIISSGSDANGIRAFTSLLTNASIATATFVPNEPSHGGDERESVAKIKYNAPKSYTAQNRAITTEDYASIMLSQPNIDSVIVWGGEDNDPPQYGKVFIAAKPKTGETLTTSEKNNLIEFVLNPKKVVTVTPEIVDPDYIYLLLDVTVKYDARRNTLPIVSITDTVLSSIMSYNNDDMSTFGKYYRQSKISRAIDSSERSILSSTVNVRMRKEVTIQLGVNARYEIIFANAIDDVTSGRPPSHPFGSGNKVSSNEFTYNGFANCFLEENGGIIRIYRRFGAGFVAVDANAGTVDYNTGKIVLTNFGPDAFLDGGNTLKITAIPKEIDILSLRSQIITIRETDISITLVDDNTISLVNR